MKKLIILSVLASLVLTNCGRKKHTAKKAKEERVEIVPFYSNIVYTQDLHFIDTNLYLVEPEEFLSKGQFKLFANAIWAMIRDPKSKLFDGPYHLYSEQELKARFRTCDTIAESSFDADGNEKISKRFDCDTAFIVDNASRIEFYESWYLNTKTNMIEKETLGYTIWSYVPAKEAFRQLFMVFRDEKALEKCKLYEFAEY